jgi:hypothetical protein
LSEAEFAMLGDSNPFSEYLGLGGKQRKVKNKNRKGNLSKHYPRRPSASCSCSGSTLPSSTSRTDSWKTPGDHFMSLNFGQKFFGEIYSCYDGENIIPEL